MRRLDLLRQIKAMVAIEKREMKSLEESLKREIRETQRDGHEDMPSLEGVMGEHAKKAAEKDKSRKSQFREAVSGKKRRERLDLSRDFERVASGERSEEEGGDQQSETLKPASEPKIKRTARRRRRKNRDLDRGR
ncbi:MAG: hypothetical protein AB2827_14465 [Candidatus Thiodiazotropha sp.]